MTYAIDSTSRRSPNHHPRPGGPGDIRALVIHTGEGTRTSDLNTLTGGGSGVSSHYYVCRDGTIYQLVDDTLVAWHAGESEYQGLEDWNDFSLGIETEHRKGQDWPRLQVDALAWLCRQLIAKYKIRQGLIVAHRWIATNPRGRKEDPTNWPDDALRSWISGLYAQETLPMNPIETFNPRRRYQVKTPGVWLRSSPYRREDNVKLNDTPAGLTFLVDAVVSGDLVGGSTRWLRLAGTNGSPWAYVHESQVELVPETVPAGYRQVRQADLDEHARQLETITQHLRELEVEIGVGAAQAGLLKTGGKP